MLIVIKLVFFFVFIAQILRLYYYYITYLMINLIVWLNKYID